MYWTKPTPGYLDEVKLWQSGLGAEESVWPETFDLEQIAARRLTQ